MLRPLQLSTRHAGGFGVRVGGGQHPKKSNDTRIKFKQNHIKKIDQYIGLKGHQDIISDPSNRRYHNRNHLVNSDYQITKYETERLVYVYRKETGLPFPMGEITWKFDENRNEYTSLDNEETKNMPTANFRTGQSIYSRKSFKNLYRESGRRLPNGEAGRHSVKKNKLLQNATLRERLEIPETYQDDDLSVPPDMTVQDIKQKVNKNEALFGLEEPGESDQVEKVGRKLREKMTAGPPSVKKVKVASENILEPEEVAKQLNKRGNEGDK